jgi:hypothetical protein
MYSLAAGVADAHKATLTAAALEPVLTTLMLKVAVLPVGTVYTVVLVAIAGFDCPKIPVAMLFP